MKHLHTLLIVALAACTPVVPPDQTSSSPKITLTAIRAGDTVTLTLENRSADSVGYNLCTSELQRRTGSDWARVPVDEVCTMHLASLAPGREATYEKRLPPGLEAGEYRYVAGIETPLNGGRTVVESPGFRVSR